MKKERGKKKEKKELINPRGPRSELKAAATTTVGSMKGTAVRARRMDFPRKSKRENKTADGRPRSNVRRVERIAW